MRNSILSIFLVCLPGLLNAQLAAHYRFNNNINDESGNNNHGTNINSTVIVNDRFNQANGAYTFNGTNQYLDVPHSASLQITTTVSIIAWVKRTQFGIDIIIEKGGDWTTGTCNYGLGLNNINNNMFYFYYNGGWRGVDGVNDFNWHQYAAIAINGNSNPTLYIDGVQKNILYSGGAASINLFSSTANLHIGAQTGSFIYYSKNTIDEIKIYNGAITSQQILNDYMLVAHYRLKNNVTDLSGYNNHGTVMNGATTVNDRFNQANGSYAFDGINQYLDVPHNGSLQITGTVSMIAWVKRTQFGTDFILEKGGEWSNGTCNYAIGLHNSTYNKMFFFSYNGGWRGVDGVNDFNWHHYAVVATNGNANPVFFIDGVQKAITQSGGSGVINLFASTDAMHIGAQPGAFTAYGKNIIDEIKIYNQPLTAQQITDDYILTAKPGTTPFNKSVLMNGINDIVDIGNLGAMPNQGTITYWMRTNASASYPNTMTTGDIGGCSNGNNAIRFEQSGNIFGCSVSSAGTGCSTSGATFTNSLQVSTIYNVAFSWNKTTNNITGYLDGVQAFNTTITNWPTAFFATKLGVGWGPDRKWNGSLDEFTFWNKILTPTEVQDVMQNNFSTEDPNLYAYYNFDNNTVNGQNQTVVNVINPGMNNGITVGTPTTPVFIPGLNVAVTTITTQPTNQIGCIGGNVTFSVIATGISLNYQWRKNTVNIPGATSSSYTITGIIAADAGNYDVVVSGLNGTATSNTASLTIGDVTIINHPVSQSACTGGNITFSVTATGAGTLTYQWKKDGNIIGGATSSSYTINNIAAGDAGNYTVEVTGTCGTISSNTATLAVSANTAITVQPGPQTICAGGNVTFSVAATGTSLTYQWRKNTANIPGANSSSYTITGATTGDAGNYDVIVGGTCGTVTSNTAALIVNASTSITSQPIPQTVCAGGNATFAVTATGAGLTYQWRKNMANIPGATLSSYTIIGATTGDAGNYDVVVTGTCGAVTSNTAALIVNAITAITAQPNSQTVCSGSNAIFSVTATGTSLTYQWRKNTANIPGATLSTYTITGATAGDAGSYDIVVSGACGTVTSSAVVLTVNATTVINIQPSSQAICPGNNVTFSVTASGTNLSYQWRKNGININGATSASYTINNVTAGDAGNYDVVVTGSCGTSVSAIAVLSINQLPAITTQPVSQAVFVGSSVTFTVAATGSGLSYQWRKGGVNIPSATGSSYTINNVTVSDAGNYDVVVSGTCSPAVISSIAVLTVNTASIISQPSSQSVCVGSNVSFTIIASGVNLTYQWQISISGGPFTDITAETSSTLSLNAVSISQNGNQYRCVVNGILNSNAALLTVNPLPSVTLVLPFDTLHLNSPMQILSGGLPSGGNYSSPGVSSGTFLPSILGLGNYIVTYQYTDVNGCSAAATDVFTIIPKADKVNIFPVPSRDGNMKFAVSPDLIGSTVVIYNSSGQKMVQWVINYHLTSYQFNWAGGQYTAVFRKGNTEFVRIFIIAR